MWILWSLLIGFVVGAIARLIVPGRDPMGCLMTSLLGIGGSFVGGFIARLLFHSTGNFQPAGLLLSVLGAVILLVLWRMFRRS